MSRTRRSSSSPRRPDAPTRSPYGASSSVGASSSRQSSPFCSSVTSHATSTGRRPSGRCAARTPCSSSRRSSCITYRSRSAPSAGRFFPAEVRRIWRLFREGVLHSFRALPVAGPMTLLVWVLETSRLLLVLFALGLYLPPSQVIFVAVASSLLTTVPLTPAGFGFVEIAMVYVLTTGFGLAQNDAVAVAVLDRAVSVFSVIVVGGVLYLRTQRAERIGAAA